MYTSNHAGAKRIWKCQTVNCQNDNGFEKSIIYFRTSGLLHIYNIYMCMYIYTYIVMPPSYNLTYILCNMIYNMGEHKL